MSRYPSPLCYPGGKARLARKIVALLPPHTTYCEPFAGGLSVLLAHDGEGRAEVVNDLDGAVAGFWRVLRDPADFDRFRRLAEATPLAEPVFAEAAALAVDDPVWRAWAFFVTVRQSIGARRLRFAPVSAAKVVRGMNAQASAWLSAVDMLPAVHARLRRVVVLNRPALDVIRQHDGPGTVHFCDPPYLPSTRFRGAECGYDREMTEADHEELLEALRRVRGRVLLSGYRSALYDAALTGWQRVDFDVPKTARSVVRLYEPGRQRRATECVWLNYEPEAADLGERRAA